jgi:hypothetical protein
MTVVAPIALRCPAFVPVSPACEPVPVRVDPVRLEALRPIVDDEEDAASPDSTTKTPPHCRQRIFFPTILASAVYGF